MTVFSEDKNQPRIGVAENQYDHVEKYLQKLKIPFTMIKYRDIENEEIYSKYDAIFFPCGTEMPLTSSVNILSRGSHIEGVSLNEQYYKIDMKKAGKYIAKFLANGGSAYFTDFSYIYLQQSLKPFSFYKDFPFLGEAGQVKTKIDGELASYVTAPSVTLNFTHSGWTMPSDIYHAEPLLVAESDTPLGMKKSPIAALIHSGDGFALYSSYHDSSDPFGIMRYLVFRTIYKKQGDATEHNISKWEQKLMSLVVDRNIQGEAARSYPMKLKKGKNFVYFNADGGKWLIDIFDKQGDLLFSQENAGTEFSQPLKSESNAIVTVKIIPLEVGKFYVYTAATASGMRFIPYFIHTALGILAFAILFIYVIFLRRNRSTGRIRLPIMKD